MDIWLERFALALLAAAFVSVVILNLLRLDIFQRVTLGIAIVAFSVFAAYTVKASRLSGNAIKETVTPITGMPISQGGIETRASVPATRSTPAAQRTTQVPSANETSGNEPTPIGTADTKSSATKLTSATVSAGSMTVTDEAGVPLRGVEILLVRRNGTHLRRLVTGSDGLATIQTVPQDESLTIFCALEGFSHYYEPAHDFKKPATITLIRNPKGGSIIFADGTGSIPGLDGGLNPILDTLNRTYLYARNIAIDGGKAQPVNFTANRPIQLEDAHGHVFEIEIVAIIGASSLIEYRRVNG